MITILNGKLTIPESERFIGFAGDNLRRTIRFLISGAEEADRIYRLYLTFDDGTVNYFVLPSEVTDEGVVLTWQVLKEHIFMSGCVKAQIKAFSDAGAVYHTTTDRFIVGDSAEFSDYLAGQSTEFLQYEQRLNELAQIASDICVLMPFIGENGNWYIYDADKGEYMDSGKPSVGVADAPLLADGSVTSRKLSDGAIDRLSLFSDDMIKKYMSLPVYTHTVSGKIAESLYNTLTDEGIHKVDDATGTHQVVVVLKPTSDAHLMQVRLSYDKLEYRGIWCTEDGVYADEDWEEWTSPIIKVDSELSSESENPLQNKVIYSALENKMNKAELFGLTKALPDTADPQILAYQTYDSTTQNMLRIPLSVLTDRAKKITDAGEYFVSEDVDGALQEIGADINNVEKVCYRDFMDSWGTFSETYERLLSKAVNLNGWFCIQRANWDDLPITTCDPVFFNYPYTVNYAIQFLTYWKPGYVYYRIVHRKTFAVYQDWKPIGGTPEPMNILAIGDSICKGNRNSSKGFVGDLSLPYKNAGVSGATISNVVTDYTNIPDQLTGVTDFDPDIIIAEGGINDYFYDAPLGTMSEVPVTTDTEAEALDRSTFTGGLEYLFYQMIKLYPKAQRFFVITHKTWKTNESMYCPTTANTQGWTQQDLHDVIVKCCNLYNVKVIDVYNDSMINSLFPEYRSDVAYSTDSSVTNTEYVDYDGVHPLAYGYLQGYVPLIKKALGNGTAK